MEFLANSKLRRLAIWLAIAPLAAGCASARNQHATRTEDMLARAGFERRSAEDPGVAPHAKALPVRQLVHATRGDGSSRWVFNDPKGCNCVYVGDDTAYGDYEDMVRVERQYEPIEGEEQAQRGLHDWSHMEYEAQSGLW